MRHIHYEPIAFAKFLFSNAQISILWLFVRLFVGWEWLSAGWSKLHSPLWWGDTAGNALAGFIQGSLQKTTGLHPDVYEWYANFLQNTVLPNVTTWSHLVAIGETLIGIALILGFMVGVSAFFGAFMNFNFLLAGTVSANPTFFLLGVLLIMAWRVAGYIGLDYYVIPKLSRFFHRK
jgi:thiosulfate dehydrogenase [quinone] large subunit